jgi:RNA polymerase sigma-70 factor (ECF subfamily)
MTECLQANERKVFCLAIIIGLPHRLITEILDMSISSVKTTLHRAKKRWFGYMENKCSLIRKSNPCNCKQFVRFGLSRGWVSRETAFNPLPPIIVRAKEDIRNMQTLLDFYKDLYQDKADESFAQRMREGIKSNEWLIFS